jgi:hypothetical protein
MRIFPAIIAWHRRQTFLALFLRVCCVLYICLTHILFGSGFQVSVSVPASSGLNKAPAAEDAERFGCCDNLVKEDAMLLRASENDPFLILLSLIAAVIQPPSFMRDTMLSASGIWCADAHRSNALPQYRHFLSPSAHLLC